MIKKLTMLVLAGMISLARWHGRMTIRMRSMCSRRRRKRRILQKQLRLRGLPFNRQRPGGRCRARQRKSLRTGQVHRRYRNDAGERRIAGCGRAFSQMIFFENKAARPIHQR